MFYAIYCLDKPESNAIRAANRDAHLAHVAMHQHRILTAGPLLSENNQMIGSLLIMDFPDQKELDQFVTGDPYAKAGLFARVDIRPYKPVFPEKVQS